ncbi:hypothetical protein C1645_775533 [Glomus cerebriforme]|uniref:Yeast cell wall synthesis Kre9/Knh1-like N-terminal domain-containing protein n=1 Tax=Glomus cerebriforme TaxID=658196 RepID=A0A397SWN6_9GLOM|nr:hypothetical protein C1645_775533 [Glomus cerebriforme]
MRIIQIILFLLAFIATFASATIQIIYPSAQYYLVAGQANEVLWTKEITDTTAFSIFLINSKIVDLKEFALANNVDPRLNKTDVLIGQNLVNTGFQIIFTDIGNITNIYATSEPFEIKPNGTAPIAYVTPTPTPTGTSNSPSVDTSKKSSSNSIHNYGFGTLVLITLLTIILF